MNTSIYPSSPITEIRSKNRAFSLKNPILVGILNITPDSFSDGGQFQSFSQTFTYAKKMITDGADWIDIGGESSGPGSKIVSLDEELSRTIPIIEAIRKESNIWISVDTYKAEVAQKAIEAGADVINDVTALREDPKLVKVLTDYKIPVILTYSKDTSVRTTTNEIEYEDVILTIEKFFEERLLWSLSQGISSENIILDPGMGFFISGESRYSFEIIRRLPEITKWGFPVMIGTSRKSFLAKVTPGKTLALHERETPTSITSAIAAWQGASLLRLHDVQQGRLLIDTVKSIQDLSEKD